jgi:hypothetical protein
MPLCSVRFRPPSLMKLPTKFILPAACLTFAVSLPAQTLVTDFSSDSDWAASTQLLGSGAALSVSGGVANYTAGSPGTDSDFVLMRNTGVVGSYTSDWSVRIDTNYAIPSTIFDSGIAQFVNLGLLAVETGVTPGISGGNPTFYAFSVASNLYQNASNARSRDIRISTFTPSGSTDDATRYAQGAVSAASAAAIQISFNATTKVLSGGYDANGATGGYSFTSIPTLTSDASTWGMTGSDTFSIYLMGNSGRDDAPGTGPGITAGEATFDNLYGTSLTAVPEPSTYAGIAGALALGIVAMRRRRAGTAA